ncbi:MAG: F0F1 ATP synthase subunit B [Chloroflexi bacterium]|nr:F0F1 ATP synthase subunit B [Chloroflexota bacterium]
MEGLGISIPTLIAQIVNFAILFGLLYLVAYKPLMRIFDERSRRVKESIEQTEDIKKQAARAEEDSKKRIEEAGREGQVMIAKALSDGEEVRRQAREGAGLEAEAIIARARAEIQRERDGIIDELHSQFADLTIMAAGKIIDRSLDKEEHRQLIDNVLKESSTFKKD